METLLLIIHLIIALSLVGAILLQRSEGGALGIGGNSGGMGSMFSARGTANLLTRMTAVLAVLFITTSLLLAIVSGRQSDGRGSIADEVGETIAPQSVDNEPLVPFGQ